MSPLILASASTARVRLLRAAGVVLEVIPAGIDEEKIKTDCRRNGFSIDETACKLAELKALHVSGRHPGRLVLGADQILDFDGEAVGKCATLAEANHLLRQLRGRSHRLASAAAMAKSKEVVWRHVNCGTLVMRNFSDAFLADYFVRAGESALQAVGCYEIEGFGAQLFEGMEGDFFSTVGLPLLPVLGALREHGLIEQ